MHFRIPSLLLIGILAGTPAGAADDYPHARLPDTVRPERYTLALNIDPRTETFTGQADIAVQVRQATQRIWLHGSGLTVSSAVVEAAGRKYPARYEQVDPISGVARLDVDSDLPVGAATIHLAYSAGFRTGAEGFFRVQAGDGFYVFSQMEPIDARRAFPGFDEPRFKTPFAISIVAPAGNEAVSNAPLTATEKLADGRVKYTFAPTLPLPTYLVAIAVGPLDMVTAPPVPPNDIRKTPLPLRGVATRGQGPKLALALRETPELVRRLEQYFGIAYPYPKLDLIASPEMAGAMENAGAILFSDTLILLAPDAPLPQLRSFGGVTAHEIAHHWVGDLVTPVWWDDIWLNESFAEWSGYKIADQWRPDLGLRTGLTLEALEAMSVDSQRAGRPVREPIDDNTRIASTFDSITYQKGGGVLAMFESYMGEKVFQRGIHEHLLAHAHGNATAQDFFGALARVAGQPVLVDAFRSFIEQPGVPLVTVRASADGRKLELSQARYRPLGSTIPPGGAWKIPFCASLLGGAKPQKLCTLMTGPTAALELPASAHPSAVMPNAAGAGYYRFAMDPAAIDKLLAVATTLDPGEGLALADSVDAAFQAGTLKLDKVLSATAALSRHRDRLVAVTLGSTLLDLGDRVLDSGERAQLESKLVSIYGPRLREIGFDPRAGVYAKDPVEQQLMRRSLLRIVAEGARDKEVSAVLADAARASLTNPAALDVGIRDVAWSVAARDDASFADTLMKQIGTMQDGLMRQHAAGALGSAEQPATAARVRTLAIDANTRTIEGFLMLGGQFASPVVRDDAWRWLRDNFDSVLHRLPGFAQSSAFEYPSGFCDTAQRKELADFLSPRSRELGMGELELARTLEHIDLCVAQKTAHAADIKAALGSS
ncbi:MAG TPA: M1 family metallopeptidase [Steroidobacteraceae bacterium]|nr:M1 family metallopeptidase [Steroidobacteraceae bacterium]